MTLVIRLIVNFSSIGANPAMYLEVISISAFCLSNLKLTASRLGKGG